MTVRSNGALQPPRRPYAACLDPKAVGRECYSQHLVHAFKIGKKIRWLGKGSLLAFFIANP